MKARVATFALLLLCIPLSACSIVGPRAIAAGRMSYSEAITVTGDEQVLQSIVRERYGHRLVPLTVSGVTANVRVQSSAGINAGIGPDSSFQGNLVPLSAGVLYEDNPIISYVPIDSASYLQQLLAPIPLDLSLLVLRSSSDRKLVSRMMLERINGLKNPTRADAQGDSKQFNRAVEILSELFAYDLAETVSLGDNQFGILLQVGEIKAQELDKELIEFMRLLELNDLLSEVSWTGELPSGKISGEDDAPADVSQADAAEVQPKDADADDDDTNLAGADAAAVKRSQQEILVISIRFSAVSDASSLALTTRSVYDMFRLAAAGVDVPREHIDGGLANEAPQADLAGRLIQIKRSTKEPKGAAIATQYQGYWFYIDSADATSKLYFRTLAMLWAARLDSARQGSATPLLTVPVGG